MATVSFSTRPAQSGSKRADFIQRAKAYISGQFTDQFEDYFGTSSNVNSSGFAPTSSATTVSTGRAGGSKVTYAASGATGYHNECGAQAATAAAVAYDVPDQLWSPWFLETRVKLNTFTGATTEIALLGLVDQVSGLTNSDSTTGNYMAFGAFAASSTTVFSLRFNQGGTVVHQVTTVAIDTSFEHVYGFANDGLGTLYVLKNYTEIDQIDIPRRQPRVSGAFFAHERANGGTISFRRDYWGCAGKEV